MTTFTSNLPRITAYVNTNKKVSALVDSGASRTFIHRDLVNDVQPNAVSRVNLGSRDATLSIDGTACVNIQIGGSGRTIQCLVSQTLCTDLVLGVDWLRDENAVLDFRRQCLHVGTAKRVTVYWINSEYAQS